MARFTDAEKREWSLQVSVSTRNRVLADTGADLYAAASGELFQKLATDLDLMVKILWSVVRPDAERRQVTADEFTDALGGDVLEAAQAAMLEALADFFPSQRRSLLRALVQRTREAEQAAGELAAEKLRQMDMPGLVRSAFDRQTSTAPSTSTPGSSA
jgi:DNA-binding ferritin-like protein (Dps family)